MRRKGGCFLLVIFLAVSLAIFFIGVIAAPAPSVSARAAALYEPESGIFLYSKNINDTLPMASTTKIMTALIAAERLRGDMTVRVAREAVGVEGSSAYLKEGEEISASGLLYALLLRSANDAAVALAVAVAGSTESFADLMNERAGAIGLSDTHFTNPHGLDNEEHYTTAHDLALVAAEALKNETVREIVSAKSARVKTNFGEHYFTNHNKLLHLYDGACGVKTGYTKRSGRCLVGAAERDGVTLITVTLDAPSDWKDHARLFDLGFSLVSRRALAGCGDFEARVPVIGSDVPFVRVALGADVSAVLPNERENPSPEVNISDRLIAPIRPGDKVGEVVFTDGSGKIIACGDIRALEGAPIKKKRTFIDKLKHFFSKKDQRTWKKSDFRS